MRFLGNAIRLSILAVAICGCGPRAGEQANRQEGGQPPPEPSAKEPKSVEVSFRTPDGLTIHADFLDAKQMYADPSGVKSIRAVLLLHQWNSDAGSWRPYWRSFLEAGISVLSIDSRGFGRSQRQGDQRFAPEMNTLHDIAGAVSFLKGKGYERIGIAGASYGANNALIYAAEHPEVRVVALLSPGEDYHGLKIEEAARKFQGKAFTILAEGDTGTGKAKDILQTALGERLSLVLLKGDKHGTDMLENQPDLTRQLVRFLHANL